jgi:hypothetical protein
MPGNYHVLSLKGYLLSACTSLLASACAFTLGLFTSSSEFSPSESTSPTIGSTSPGVVSCFNAGTSESIW